MADRAKYPNKLLLLPQNELLSFICCFEDADPFSFIKQFQIRSYSRVSTSPIYSGDVELL